MNKIIFVGYDTLRALARSRRVVQGLAAALIAMAAVVVAPAAPSARAIIGGDIAAHLWGQVQVEQDGEYICTGSLIALDWVLTAEHCLDDDVPMSVHVGSKILGSGEARRVVTRVRHRSADVALLQLNSPVTQPNWVISYDDTRRPPNANNVGIHGWGNTVPGDSVPSAGLKSASLRVDLNRADAPGAPPTGALGMRPLHGIPTQGDSGAAVVYNHRVMGVYIGYRDDATQLQFAVALEAIRGWIEQHTGRPPANTALATKNLRVMPLGDSITYGTGSSTGSGYRAELWHSLDGTAKDLDLVGSQQSGDLPDRDNEGYPGAMINDIARRADSAVPLYDPNVVLLHAGTNDMDRGDAAAAPAALGSLIDQVFEDAPKATVLVSTLVPSKNSATEAKIEAFNKQIPGVVDQRARTGKHVAVVDMSEVTTDDLSDYLHPNDRGYTKMGDEFEDAILAVAQEGWIADTDDQTCTDTPGRWLPRGKIASGTGLADDEEVQFADIDGDGRDDYLVVNDESGAVKAWINAGGDQDGKPGWIERGQIASGVDLGQNDHIDFADINGDGRDDYLVYNVGSGAVKAWINIGGDQDGKPGWIERGQIASGVPDAPARPVFADVDGDRRADYLLANPRTGAVRAWINAGGDQDGKPGWIERGQIASGVTPMGAGPYFANVDCDIRADYLIADLKTSAVKAWLNRGGDQDGKPGWIERGQIASGSVPEGHTLAFADIDGDGRDDYLAVNVKDGSVQAWINKGGDPA
ncbi:hypothetical protein GCM10022254_33540 [Actinomadura meridiana]|uniref:Peptidase S1 domain-containing protein n=1 Tax=Actinomadura meridiana TaxID=559626 RepID=A0ABP8C2Z2_9ACTN